MTNLLSRILIRVHKTILSVFPQNFEFCVLEVLTSYLGRFHLVEGEFRNYGKGRSKELAAAKRHLDEGKSIRSLAQIEFDCVIRHRRNLQWYRDEVVAVPVRPLPSGRYIHGPSGVGKTRHVLEHYPPSDSVFWFNCTPKNGDIWWEGYDRHSTVVLNDFNCGSLGLGVAGFEYAKQIFDYAPFRVAVHGQLVPFVAHTFIFTANRPPQAIWDPVFTNEPWDDRNPIMRRFRDYFKVELWGTEDERYYLPVGEINEGGVSQSAQLNSSSSGPALREVATSGKAARQARRKKLFK